MTLIVGIKCEDGVVMGADGAATLGVMGQSTARQATKKLEILNNRVVVGVSGSVGLAQRIRGEIQTLWDSHQLTKKKPHEIMVTIRNALWRHVEPEMQAAQVASRVVGPAVASQSCICTTMIALPMQKYCGLFQFDQQCAPEEASDGLPFISIGSGQPLADPFLAFIRRIFWRDRLPTKAEGIFAALWTLQHAIDTAPGGIGDPTQIVLIESESDDRWQARELLSEELQEHKEAISCAEHSLSNFREAFEKNDIEESPPPPHPQ